MVVHAAFGGSTNLLLHIPAIAHAAGLRRPTVDDWTRINRAVPRLVDALPNGPRNFATVQVFLAGGVPEVMLHLRRAGLLDTSVLPSPAKPSTTTSTGGRQSKRRRALQQRLRDLDGIDPDDVIMSPDRARSRGLTATVCFPVGNLAPKAPSSRAPPSIPPSSTPTNVYRHVGPARVFTTEAAAIAAIKHGAVGNGDVMVLICGGPARRRHAGDLPGHLRPQDPRPSASTSPSSPTRASAASPPAPASATSLPKPSPAAPSARSATATSSRSRRPQRLHGTVDFVGTDGDIFTPEEGARRPRRARSAPRPRPAPRPPRRHPPLGRARPGQRRHLGRLRLRHRRHHPPDSQNQRPSIRMPPKASIPHERSTRPTHPGCLFVERDGTRLPPPREHARRRSCAATISTSHLAAAINAAPRRSPPPRTSPRAHRNQEVWASGVTYYRSRRRPHRKNPKTPAAATSTTASTPPSAPSSSSRPRPPRRRPGWPRPHPPRRQLVRPRTRTHPRHQPRGEIIGYTVGNDMSSRDIEGENPLYLPQAKVYDGSCALGPCILLQPEPVSKTTADPDRDQASRSGRLFRGNNADRNQARPGRTRRVSLP